MEMQISTLITPSWTWPRSPSTPTPSTSLRETTRRPNWTLPPELTLTSPIPPTPDLLGVGVDLVHVPSFEEQLADPGTTFGAPGRFFSARELRWAQSRADQKGDGVAIHLAGVWAAKEAAVKAWVGALVLSVHHPRWGFRSGLGRTFWR